MKKTALLLSLAIILFVSNNAFADVFDSLENITPAQRHQISTIQNSFKIKNNDFEMRISEYTDKIAKITADSDKTTEQKALLTSAYERNIATLKSQQELLQKETEAQYKSILTPEQFKQYQALQLNVQNAFSNFLQK